MKSHFTLFVSEGDWRIGMVRETQVTIAPTSPGTDLNAKAIAAARQLVDMEYQGQPVMLAIPSAWCLCATIETDRLERGQRRKTMIYLLEEQLPIASEQFVADFIDQGGSAALGVCCELERLESLLAALASAGIAVGHISPMVMLTAATLLEEHASLDILLACDGDGQECTQSGHDVIAFDRRRPVQWQWLGNDDEAAEEHLHSLADKHGGTAQMSIVGEQAREATFLKSVGNVRVLPRKWTHREQAAALAGSKVLAGKASPWIELRRDVLAPADAIEAFRQPLTGLAYAAVLLLVSVIAVTQYRGGQYEALASEHSRSQAEVFKKALPNQRLPASVRARLQSEHQRLSELSGDGTSATSSRSAGGNGAIPASALESLHTAIAGLPAHIRFRIVDLSIEPGLIRIDGQAQSHVDAEQIAVSLERTGKLDIEPPRTQALAEGGVQFNFTAKPRAATITTGAQR